MSPVSALSGRTKTDLYLTQRPNPNLNGVPRRASTCSKASLYPLRWMSARRSRRRTCKQCAAVDATNLRAGQGDRGMLLSASKHDGRRPPRYPVAIVAAIVPAVVRPVVAAVAAVIIGRIAVAVGVGRIAVAIAIRGVIAVGRIVVGVSRTPQRRANQRTDGECAETPSPTPTPAGFRRFRGAHGDCAGEQHGNQRSSHGFTSLFFISLGPRPANRAPLPAQSRVVFGLSGIGQNGWGGAFGP